MHSLLGTEPFEDLAGVIRTAAARIPTESPLTLMADSTIVGTLSLAHIEAALLDASIPYQRRTSNGNGVASAAVIIRDDPLEDNSEQLATEPFRLTLAPMRVEALHGHDGSPHSGMLSPVAQAAALAAEISPDGKRVRGLRPWALAGNWLANALDIGYDPAYSRLRDHLSDEGSIRVVPLPDVTDPDPSLLPALDAARLSETSESWSKLDEQGRAEALSEIAVPEVFTGSRGTARLEELLWLRPIVADRPRDLHSQIAVLERRFVEDASTAMDSSIDELLSTGELA